MSTRPSFVPASTLVSSESRRNGIPITVQVRVPAAETHLWTNQATTTPQKGPRRARKMSTRTILNKTSQKKRDHMLSFSNTTASDPFSPTFPLAPPSCHSEPDPPSPPSSYSYGMQLDALPRIPTDNVVRSTCPFARRNRYLPLALRSASHWKPITLRRGSGDASASLQRMISTTGPRYLRLLPSNIEWNGQTSEGAKRGNLPPGSAVRGTTEPRLA